MILDLFAGPGGWDAGLHMIGRTDVLGIEWDRAACDTALAAGHARLWADVAALPVDAVVDAYGQVEGLIASPPCQAWSMAGKRKGEKDRATCHRLADGLADGDDYWAERVFWEDDRSPLVCEPVRWVRDLEPEWIALEEVPAVASLWEHFARIFRGWGYSVWTGDLNAADYGVPQTRTRRILMAHKSMTVQPPEPTHAQNPQPGADLFGGELLPWVSMAEALGWGFDSEPSATVSGGGGDTGGPEPFANAGYRARLRETVLASRRDSPAWVAEHGERENRTVTQPAPTFTAEAHRWAWDRPATTLVGSFCPDIVAAPGYRTETSRQNAEGSVRVTVQEAGILQSFPADYPWQGSRSKQFQQVGNAVPPLLAAHILSALGVGVLRDEVAA